MYILFMVAITSLIIFVYLYLYVMDHPRKYKPLRPVSPSTNKRITDPVVCNSQFGREFIDGRCECMFPFKGDDCSEEHHSPNYKHYTGSDLGGLVDYLNNKQPKSVNRLSYPYWFSQMSPFGDMPQIQCTDLCDSTPTCLGVVYRQSKANGLDQTNMCYLLDDLSVGAGTALGNKKGKVEGVYLKSDITYTDRIFLDGDISLPVTKNVSLIPISRYPRSVKAYFSGTIVLADNKELNNSVSFSFSPGISPINISDKKWTKLYGKFS